MTRRTAALSAAALSCIALTFSVRAEDTRLLSAVRANDTRTVSALLKAGADPNTRDDIGATALMHAAAFASPGVLRILLDGGADVNASSNGEATALMWATGEAANVGLLLDRGAAVNARRKDGTTALITAARRGNVDAMRMLLAHGADPKSAVNEKAELLRVAHGDHPETRQILDNAGVALKGLPATAVPALANYPVSSTAAILALLDLGASPNPRGRFPFVGVAAFEGQLATARLLVEHGANLDARGQQDVTPLMMAAAATHPDPAIVRLLMAKGADVNARDKAGRTALDWAVRQGETEVVRVLREAGATSTVTPPPPASIARPRGVRAAVTEAIARLRPIGPTFYEHTKCISCHHQSLPLLAMTLASARGIAVDADAVAHPVQAITDVWNRRRENFMLANGRDGGGANELSYSLLAFAEARVPSNTATDAATSNLLSTQRPDGSWVFFDVRPPQADNSPIPFTAMAVRGLEVCGLPGQRAAIGRSIARAREYLRAASPASTQDEAFKLMGLVWSHRPAAEISAQAKRLTALQRESGGWAQLPTMTPDAYATGEALYALHVSGMSPKSSSYQKGASYLLRTQLEDGTWFVRSRAFGFQPYFESGFPHGTDQFISASATAWAAIALAPAL